MSRAKFLFVMTLGVSLASAQAPNAYIVSTVAGIYPLGDGGPATSALLFGPRSTVIAANGDIYVADTRNRSIRRINSEGSIATFLIRESYWDIATGPAGVIFAINTAGTNVYRISPTGTVTTYAGIGRAAFGGDGAQATLAAINAYNIAADSRGVLYIADAGNNRIRKVTTDGVISTVAGSARFGSSGDNGPATSAQLNFPQGVAVDRNGVLYIADTLNNRIRRVSIDGIITTFAGNGTATTSGDGGNPVFAGIPSPTRVSLDQAGNLYVVSSNRVRRITPGGQISTFAGNGQAGYTGDGGPATQATFYSINGVTEDSKGGILICDYTNDRIRRVDGNGIITTFAGAGHFVGDNGPATDAIMKFPEGVTMASDGTMYITDAENYRLRAISPNGVMRTVLGNGVASFADGPATSARAGLVGGVLLHSDGSLYFSDSSNHRIRKLSTTGQVSTVAGNGSAGFGGDESPATVARLNVPYGLAFDANNNLYVADSANHRIRKITPEGVITTAAGIGTGGFSGDGGRATLARLNSPRAVTFDRLGSMYISDGLNNRVRKVDLNGIITTIAGDGNCCSGGDNGPALSARIGLPAGLLFDSGGNLVVAAYNADQIRRISPDGNIITIAGTGSFGWSGDGGVATQARLDGPIGLFLDNSGNLFFADQANHRIRKLSPLIPSTLSIAGGDGQTGAKGSLLAAPLTVKVVSRDGIGVPGVPVTFTVIGGPIVLASETAVTRVDGIASVQATFGDAAGEAMVRATASGIQSVQFRLTATAGTIGPGPGGGGISTKITSIMSGGQSDPPLAFVAPNSQAWIVGEGFTTPGVNITLTAADLRDGRLPLTLGDVCVPVAGTQAPIFAVSPTRIGFIVPDASGDVSVRVAANCGSSNEVLSDAATLSVFPVSPEFYYSGPTRDGRRPVLMLDPGTGSDIPNAKPGDTVQFILTGLGTTSPPTVPGELGQPNTRLVETIRVQVGGIELRSEDIVLAGASTSFPGLYDLRLRLPSDLRDGDAPIIVNVAGLPTAEGVVVSVRGAR